MSTIFTTSSLFETVPFPYESAISAFPTLKPIATSRVPFELAPVFENNSGENMIDQMLLAQFDENLSVILTRELNAGNKIAEVWSGWPHRESIFVILETPFKNVHQSLPRDIDFKDINDPHYWKAEYYHRVTHHCLACRF